MAEDTFTLYYFPVSYYSQKAYLAFFEKGVNYRRQFVDIQNGYHFEPWYMRLNPNGTIPTLRHGDKILTESEDIMRYLDKIVPTEPILFPDPQSPVGKEVEVWFRKFSNIHIEQITFGILRHPELSVSGPKIPKIMRSMASPAGVQKRFQRAQDTIKKYAEKYPDLRETYLAKLESRKSFYTGDSCSIEQTKKVLDDLDLLLDETEERIKKTIEVQGSPNCWLLGQQFTAADILVTILLDRINMIGLGERYLNENKRPLLSDYYKRLGNRASVQKLRAHFKDGMLVLLGSKVKQTLPTICAVTVLGLAIGIGFYFYKNRS